MTIVIVDTSRYKLRSNSFCMICLNMKHFQATSSSSVEPLWINKLTHIQYTFSEIQTVGLFTSINCNSVIKPLLARLQQ